MKYSKIKKHRKALKVGRGMRKIFGRLGGRGAVLFKGAREGHDMRFDVPVIGLKTVKTMKRAGVTALAFQAGRQIVLEKEAVIAYANRHGIALVGVKTDLPPAPTRPQ